MSDTNYLLLDAARMHGDIYRARELNPDHTCLYEGDNEKFLSAVAPWLFSVEAGSEFAQWVAKEGKGKSWGVLFRSDAEPVKLYKHLRKFLIVESEDGKEMYFRYYDPRVLRVFLPTCEPEQLKEFFGPIASFLIEDANGLLTEYTEDAGKLIIAELGFDAERLIGGAEERIEGTTEGEGTPVAPQEAPREPTRTSGSAGTGKGWDFGY